MYNTYRNKVSKMKQEEERKHIASLLEANRTNLRKTWAVLKSIINKKETKEYKHDLGLLIMISLQIKS